MSPPDFGDGSARWSRPSGRDNSSPPRGGRDDRSSRAFRSSAVVCGAREDRRERYVRAGRASYGKQVVRPIRKLADFPDESVKSTFVNVPLPFIIEALVTVKVLGVFAVGATVANVASCVTAVNAPV